MECRECERARWEREDEAEDDIEELRIDDLIEMQESAYESWSSAE
jgi:hypothetical protein